ncbi:hypothetical protein PMAYCL1PPCAC_01486, partial [Pristionchus mayeri]
ESLPWPALTRLFSHLLDEEDCADLANLAKVSTHIHKGVNEFMKKNRPAIKHILIGKSNVGIFVDIYLLPSNLPFYYLSM